MLLDTPLLSKESRRPSLRDADSSLDVQPRAEDLSFSYVTAWKEETGGRAIGHYPVYAPQEIIRAAGALPVGIMGAWGLVDVDYADSRVQSFVCSVAASTLELGLTGRLVPFDGMVFSDICDIARNLSGIFTRNFPEMLVEYLHLPQNASSQATVPYLRKELERLARHLEKLTESPLREEDLLESIELYNRQRALLGEAYELRQKNPELLPIDEAYLLARAAGQMPVEDHIALLEGVLPDIRERPTKARDNIRVLAMGPFCEQPPLELLRVIEEAGCYVVDDELLRAYRWYTAPIPGDGDPFQSLARSYVERSHVSSVRYPGGQRGEALVEWVKQAGAEGVLFVTAKFCEPALYDYVLYKEFLEKAGIPYMHMEFEEKMSAFESPRMQVETFVESILFA